MWLSKLVAKLEQAKALDPWVDGTADAVNRILPGGAVKDLLHGKWLGHPLHPLLVALPIGFWTGASLLDLTSGERGEAAAQRLVGLGVLAVAPTAAAGWADWSELGSAKAAKRIGVLHALANQTAALLYGVSWLARRKGNHKAGVLLALAGGGAIGAGGYLGGHLAYSQAVGVNRNADVGVTPRDWTDAAAATDVAEGALVAVEVAGETVMLTRRFGEVLAIHNRCSHYGGPLNEGEINADGCVVCPWHGSQFRVDSGDVARGPATMPQPAYDVRTVGDRLQIKARL